VQLVLLIGIQATGKSAFCQKHLLDSHIRLNLDMLRTRHRERLLFEACLAAKQPVVVDNTNPTRAERSRYIGRARAARFEVEGYFFESRVQDAIRRNTQRSDGSRVPQLAIRGTSRRLELPTKDEGFDRLYFVRLIEATQEFDVQEWCDEV
jgi:predicted kinase